MSRTDFDRFVQRQQAEQKKEKTFDPKERIGEWRSYLDVLYKQVTDYMAPYIAEKAAEIKFSDIELNEEFIGRYNVPRLLLQIGRSEIKFTPIGTMLIGGSGRVDVEGPRGNVRLVVVGKTVEHAHQLIKVTMLRNHEPISESSAEPSREKFDWAWKIMSPPPEITFTELSSANFFDMILSVANA